MSNTKKCTKCGEVKSLNDFYKRKKAGDGVCCACKPCSEESLNNYRRTKKGLLGKIHSAQRQSSKRRGHTPPEYTLNQFRERYINDETFNKLFNEWVESGYEKMLSPSFDRLYDSKGYSFDNLNAWMAWKDNDSKARLKSKNGGFKNFNLNPVIGTYIETGEEFSFISKGEAERKTGVFKQSISKNIKGLSSHAGGYIWRLNN